ncbi:MAG: transglutaminase-like domain-containing protein [Planctomycetota bacterium]|nr:transglutaminase-like domain-containing protein [Planctomycetota bacterium]
MSFSSRSCAISKCALLFSVLLVLALPARGQAPAAVSPTVAAQSLEDRWYQLSLGGKPCGSFHEWVERQGETIRSMTETEMSVGRMGQGVTLRTKTTFEETARGVPLRAEIVKTSGAAPVRCTWTFTATDMEIADEQADRRTVQRRPLPAPGWLPPYAADEFVRHRLASGAKELRYVTLDPESGPDAVQVESVLKGSTDAEVDGRTVRVTEWSTKTSLIERPSAEFMSSDGVLVRSTTDLGVGILESRLTTRAIATAATAPVEIMARTFISLTGNARALSGSRHAELEVTAKDSVLATLPSAGAQVFSRTGAGAARVMIDADASSIAPPADVADARFTRASVMADSDDPAIRALAQKSLIGCAALPLARAEALRSAVNRYITNKNLASGFATASEAVKSRSGDCTEHAVLLCALLRTQGIPARVASGLLYVPQSGAIHNAYGWHMWTQAIIDGKWVDFDAVLAPDGPRFDASHILTGLSAADGASIDSDLSRIVDLMGDTAIEVRSIDGKPVAASKGSSK